MAYLLVLVVHNHLVLLHQLDVVDIRESSERRDCRHFVDDRRVVVVDPRLHEAMMDPLLAEEVELLRVVDPCKLEHQGAFLPVVYLMA